MKIEEIIRMNKKKRYKLFKVNAMYYAYENEKKNKIFLSYYLVLYGCCGKLMNSSRFFFAFCFVFSCGDLSTCLSKSMSNKRRKKTEKEKKKKDMKRDGNWEGGGGGVWETMGGHIIYILIHCELINILCLCVCDGMKITMSYLFVLRLCYMIILIWDEEQKINKNI